MPTPEYETSPSEVRTFAFLQLGLTTVFLALLFLAFGGTDADFPPWWLIAVLLAVVGDHRHLRRARLAVGQAHETRPGPRGAAVQAVGIFAGQIVRKLAYCEAGVIFAVIVGFAAAPTADGRC